ncbi:uncharacterized protein LOC111117700 [Crassostrea virginica]
MFRNILFLLFIQVHVRSGYFFEIKTYFYDGNLTFTWPPITTYQDVGIKCDGHFRGFSRVYDNKIMVSNVLDYEVIEILVRGVAGHGYQYLEQRKQFRKKIMVMFEGSDVIMTLSNPQISTKSDYNVFRINNVGSSIIHHLTIKEYASQSYTLELNNVTSLDAGYYGIGADEMESRSSNGVVLVIKAFPSTPIISGNQGILRGEKTTLTCNSISRSKPYYYKKFPVITYTWLVNDSEIKHSSQTLTLNIHTSTVIKCRAKEDLTSTSAGFLVEPLYGPEVVKIIPAFNGSVTIHDGAFFGPVTCTADCSPPCKYQWREVTWNGDINDVINASTLPQQVVHAGGVSKYYCVATGFHGTSYSTTTVSREISLNIQYLDLPKVITEFNGLTTNRSTVNVKEGTTVSLKCMGTGNPKPDVYIATILNGRHTLSSNSLNELLLENIQCEDTCRYTCTARSPGFNDTSTYVEILVKCSPRLDKSVTFHQHYQSDIENNVTVLVPIIAYPKPQNISWVGGPLTAPRYTIEGTITPKEMSYVYRYLVKGNIRLVNESIFGNTTLYIDGVEVVTMFILKKEAENASSLWNLSSLPGSTYMIIFGGVLGLFSILIVFYLARRHINKSGNARNADMNNTNGGTRSREETYLNDGRIYYYITVSPFNRDSEYERIPNQINHFDTSGGRQTHGVKYNVSSFQEIEPEAETYMHDGRMYYSIRETSTEERNPDYEKLPEMVQYIE